jgi:hypothetical protein
MIDDDKLVDPLESLLETAPAEMAFGPDGGFAPQAVGLPAPIPEASTDTMVCLRGPCRHYYEVRQAFDAGNPVGSLEKLPVQYTRACFANPGSHIDLTDEAVFGCLHWDPQLDEERISRQRAWCDANPNVRKGLPDGY